MNLRLLNRWDAVRTSFWFIPAAMTLASIALFVTTVQYDRAWRDSGGSSDRWLWSGGAEGARAVLAAIAGSTITVTGLVFSITMVVLTLATQKFGPRLLRSFMRDTCNQVTLGVFVATFVYCLLTLSSVRSDNAEFVPHISLTCGLLLSLISTGVLIYFIHHVSSSIQVENLVFHIGVELRETIDRLFPEVLDNDVEEAPPLREKDSVPEYAHGNHQVSAWETNYLQSVDTDLLMRVARENKLLIKLPYRPGQFVLKGNSLADVSRETPESSAYPASPRQPGTASGNSQTVVSGTDRGMDRSMDRVIHPDLVSEIEDAFEFGSYRTATQDPEYSVQQLVEIAARALSPGVNEPLTAITCLDWLSAALARLAARPIAENELKDEAGQTRIVLRRVTFAGMTDASLDMIRQYGCSNPAVAIRLLQVLSDIAPHTRRQADRDVLLRHANLVMQDSDRDIANENDRQDVDQWYRRTITALGTPFDPQAGEAGRT